jgi:hypothetical protein
MFKRIGIIAFVALLLIKCAPARYVKPLKKNEQVVSLTFGGPVIQFAGAPIPIPFTTLGYAYGLNDKITTYAHLHTTSLLFGNVQLDAGATIGLYEKEKKYGFSVSPALQIATSLNAKKSFRIWPSSDFNFYYHPKQKESYLYSGLNTWFELSSKKAHQEAQNTHVIPNIHAGYVIIKNKWNHQFQLSYLGIGISNLPNVASYVGIAQKGSFGFHYALIRKF